MGGQADSYTNNTVRTIIPKSEVERGQKNQKRFCKANSLVIIPARGFPKRLCHKNSIDVTEKKYPAIQM